MKKKYFFLMSFLFAIILLTNVLPVSAADSLGAVKIEADSSAMPKEYAFKTAQLGTHGHLTEEYKLSKYDVINILVLGFPDGIGVNDIIVGPDGYTQLPYAGTVKLAGLTLDEAKVLLKEKLGEYIRIPDMSVMIKSYGPRKVYVMGEVEKPGVLELSIDHMNVYAAISGSGGITKYGRPKHAQLIRVVNDTMYYRKINVDAYIKQHDINQNVILQDGDIVYVPRSNKIFLQEDIMPYVGIYGLYKNLTD